MGVSVRVFLTAFGRRFMEERGLKTIPVRDVDLPQLSDNLHEFLGDVFYWGQNDFQPRPWPSVSAGDIVEHPVTKKLYGVNGMGWIVLPEGFDIETCPESWGALERFQQVGEVLA